MQAKAIARTVGVTPRKARLVVDLVRGKSVVEALETLSLLNKSLFLICLFIMTIVIKYIKIKTI